MARVRAFGAPWWDSTVKATAEELVALVTDEADRALLRRWMDNPKRLSGVELATVEDSILPAIRYAIHGSDEQVSYRWVDAETGDVDGPIP